MREYLPQLDAYDFAVPEALIAQEPARPRDAARLLVYDRATGDICEDTFRNLAKYVPPRSVIVLNDTKVIPARLRCRKETGGAVEVFYVRNSNSHIWALCDRPLAEGSAILLASYRFRVTRRDGRQYVLRPSFPLRELPAILERYGTTPIPPYIKHSPLSERSLRAEYQTVFARTRGSVAAPTAALHMTPRLLAALRRAGHTVCSVTLHVGLGTFAPLTAEQLRSGVLHREMYEVSAATARVLNAAKREGRPIVAIGTTAARTLESAVDGRGRIRGKRGATEIFIRPGYSWKFVDALVTNFHVPRSSLLMLVAALIGREQLMALYRLAIRRKFRFFSFGDGMLIR